MEKFQKLFEDMEVKSADMGQSLDQVYQGSLNQGDVDNLIKEVADENKIEMDKEMGEAGRGPVGGAKEAKADTGSIDARLNNLKNT